MSDFSNWRHIPIFLRQVDQSNLISMALRAPKLLGHPVVATWNKVSWLTMSKVLLKEGLDEPFLAGCHDVVGLKRGGGFCGDFRSVVHFRPAAVGPNTIKGSFVGRWGWAWKKAYFSYFCLMQTSWEDLHSALPMIYDRRGKVRTFLGFYCYSVLHLEVIIKV